MSHININTTASVVGTVTSFSFTNANGFTGTVTNPTSTPNLTLTAAPASTLATTFSSSGTWTKNPRTQFVEVYGFNSGGSGASGRKGSSTSAGGGGGGGGGLAFYFWGVSTCFGATENVTVGATTTGAAGQATDATNGINGSLSNTTIFGNIQVPNGGIVATGGTTGTAAGGTVGNTLISLLGVSTAIKSAGGSGSITIGGFVAISGGPTVIYLTGTGAGGGAGYDTGTARTGGNGGRFTLFDGTTTITLGGVGGSESTAINGGNGLPPATSGGIMMGGTGAGGGGGPSAGIIPGNGGVGAVPAGGGGGGAGGITGVATSGSGGNGAQGQVIIIEYF